MKKTIIVVSCTILLFSFGDRNQNSFSQKSIKLPNLKSLPAAIEIKAASFKKDTIMQNQQIQSAMDSLFVENQKTEKQIVTGNKIVKVQELNQVDLYAIRALIGKGLAKSNRMDRTLPDIMIIYGSKKPEPIPVKIDFVAPDTLPIPEIRRTFFQKLKFWKKH